jgi:hypothetical protein
VALCSLTTRRLDVPHEPGEWVEVRPLSAKNLRVMDKAAKTAARGPDAVLDETEYGYELTTRMLDAAIVAWSYGAPVSPENVADLDLATTVWLSGELSNGADVPLPSTPPLTESSPETAAE